MKKEDIIYNASIAIGKKLDYETMKYSDYMYGNEEYTDEVFEYVDECDQIGQMAFKEKYKDYKLYI